MATTDIRLFSSALCPYAQRVRIALAEKGLQAEEVTVDPRRKPVELMALSPDGKIPMLVHGKSNLWESAVINEYLEEAFPEHRLMPGASFERAAVRMLVSFSDQKIYAPTHDLLMSVDPEAHRLLGQTLALSLRWLEAYVATGGSSHLTGGGFSLADIALIPWFEQIAVLEHFRGFRMPEECPGLAKWFASVRNRVAVASVLREPEHYVAGYGALAKLQAEGRL